jgi:very-short-patch-repair endonuclease
LIFTPKSPKGDFKFLDGGIHDRKEQKEYDHMRNEHLQKFGITLMRFRNSEIFNTTEHVIRLIKNQVDNLR